MARSKVTQRAICLAIGLSQAAVSRRVSGQHPFSIQELTAIAKLVHVPLSALLGDDVLRVGA